MSGSALAPRRRLLRLIERYPGLHLRELARQTEMSEALVSHHVESLLTARLVRSETTDNYRRFFAVGGESPSTADSENLALLRQRIPLQIVILLLERGSATNQEVAQTFGIAKSTASYHLGRLLDARVVTRLEDGNRLALTDRDTMERLLLRWRAPETLTGRFVEMWGDFYGRREPRPKRPSGD
jgi:predicted transcriptional regulator